MLLMALVMNQIRRLLIGGRVASLPWRHLPSARASFICGADSCRDYFISLASLAMVGGGRGGEGVGEVGLLLVVRGGAGRRRCHRPLTVEWELL